MLGFRYLFIDAGLLILRSTKARGYFENISQNFIFLAV